MIKRLFSVAINDYPKEIYDLKGCINDQLLIYKICKEVYGFTEFKLLSNNEATKTRIKQGLNWLVTDLPKDSIVIFHYSGHGSSVPSTIQTASSEIDSMDECIVTYDFDPWDPLRDNELGDQFKNLDPSIHILVVLDACMSGSGLRGCLPNKAINKYFMPPPSLMLNDGQLDIDEDLNYIRPIINQKTVPIQPFLVHTIDQGNAILISACGEHQYAADAFFNRYHGACTFFMCKTLKEGNWNIKYKDLVTIMNKKLDDAGFTDQTPQLECSNCFEKLFLGGQNEI